MVVGYRIFAKAFKVSTYFIWLSQCSCGYYFVRKLEITSVNHLFITLTSRAMFRENSENNRKNSLAKCKQKHSAIRVLKTLTMKTHKYILFAI